MRKLLKPVVKLRYVFVVRLNRSQKKSDLGVPWSQGWSWTGRFLLYHSSIYWLWMDQTRKPQTPERWRHTVIISKNTLAIMASGLVFGMTSRDRKSKHICKPFFACLWWPAAPGGPDQPCSCTASSDCSHGQRCCRPVAMDTPVSSLACEHTAVGKGFINQKISNFYVTVIIMIHFLSFQTYSFNFLNALQSQSVITEHWLYLCI